MSALVLFLYLGEKYLTEIKTIMMVIMMQIMEMITTTGIIMWIGSTLPLVVKLLLVVDTSVLVSDSDVMGDDVVFRMIFGGEVGSAP